MYIFIVNPTAGHGKGRKVFTKIKKSKLYKGMESKTYLTEYPGHAEDITRGICQTNLANLQAIIVIGGDGTIHEVLNGLTQDIKIAFIPGGSGNDFARGCGLKGKPLKILERILSNDPMHYWLGTYSLAEEKRYFVNSIGFGFDAQIADTANRSLYKKVLNKLNLGTLSYVIAIIQVLFQFKPFTAKLEIDGQWRDVHDCWMVTISNHAYYGGGMKINPEAVIQKETLEILIIQGISKWKVLGLFLTVFTGKHITFKEVTLLQAKRLAIHTSEPIFYQVDGQTNRCLDSVISKNIPAVSILGADKENFGF